MQIRLLSVLEQLRDALQTLYGERLVEIVLYGSQARGDMQPESDIDLLVVLQGDVDPGREIARTGELVARLSLEYDVVISCLFISGHRFHHEQSPLMLNIRREGIKV